MPSKKQPKYGGDDYQRVADGIRRQVAASEKKGKHRPRVAAALTDTDVKSPGSPAMRELSPFPDRQPATLSPGPSLSSPSAASPLQRVSSPGGLLTPVSPASPMRGAASLGGIPLSASATPVGGLSASGRSPAVTPSRRSKAATKWSTGAMFGAIIGFLVLLAVAVAAGVAAVMVILRKPTAVCKTPGCRLYSEALRASIDVSADPCRDFNQYVCGRYAHPSGLSVAEAARQSYRDEVVAPARNGSLIAAGQNALQKGWRFYKSCEDVVEGSADNIATVLAGLNEAGISWPVPTVGEVNLVWAMVALATKFAWPSILDFAVQDMSKGVVQVSLFLSPYTTEVLKRKEEGDANKHEAFFNLTARIFFDAMKATTKGVEDVSFNNAVNFSTITSLEQPYEAFFGETPGAQIHLPDNEPNIAITKNLIKNELVQAMPGRVRPDHKLKLATSYEALVRWLIDEVMNRPHDLELVLGWHVVKYMAPLASRDLALAFHGLAQGSKHPSMEHKEYCFRLLKKYMGVSSITYVVERRFTAAVRRDVEAMARSIRRTYFGTLSDATYDWHELGRMLQFLQNAVSSNIPSVLGSMGDIGDNIVLNVRTMAVNSRGVDASQWHEFLSEELASSSDAPFEQVDQGKDVGILPTAIMFPYYEPDVPNYIRHGTFMTTLAQATVLTYLKYGTGGNEPTTFAKFKACTAQEHNPPSHDHVIVASAVEAAAIVYAASGGGEPDDPAGDQPLLLWSMSPWQLFYVSFCYLLCTGDARNSTCNSVLRWSTRFAQAFHCQPKSPMVAKQTCLMFHH